MQATENDSDLRKATQLKINFIQIEEAFGRAVWGESVRAIAQSLGVTEGCLRFHFRKRTSPTRVRQLAFELLHIEQVRARLTPTERKEVDRLVAKAMAAAKSVTKRHAL